MKTAATLLIAACATWAWAQAPDATFHVAGFLKNSVTGEPVKRAAVELQFLSGPQPAAGVQKTTADSGGHFDFAGVPPGIYRVVAAAHGYDRQNLGDPAGLGIVEDRADLLFQMDPFAALTGKVVDENDDPIAGVAVQLIRSVIWSGKRELQPGPSAVTNDRGEYRVASLPGGRYFASAYARAQEASENTAYARRFFPSAPDLRTALPLELVAGADQHADFRLVPEPVFHVRGQVQGGTRLSNISVMLAPSNAAEQFGGVGFPTKYLGEGRFEVSGVTPGQYKLTASAYEGDILERVSQTVAVGSADLEGVTITPQAGTILTGHVTIEGREGVAPLAPNRLSLSLLPQDSILDAIISTRLEGDRFFSSIPLVAGDYRLTVNVPKPYYVKSASVGGLDALTGYIAVPASGGTPPVEVAIAANGGEVSGQVKLQDQPAAKCLVMLIRKGDTLDTLDQLTQTDQNGKFILQAVPPGEYTAYAWRELLTVEFRNPQTLAQYSGEGVTVTEGGKHTVDLKLNVN